MIASSRARGRARCLAALLAAAAVLLGPRIPLLAQSAPPPGGTPPTFELPEVEVAGRRPQLPATTPASISVITAEEIAAMGALTVADALRVLPEVLVRSTGGPGSLTTMSIRGSPSTQSLILLDGVPLNRPDQASVDLSTVPIQQVDHIEVLRGPFSAIYGSATIGGVVNIVTRSRPESSASARIGSYGETSNVLSIGGQAGATAYLVQGIQTGSTGFAPDTDYSNATVRAKLRWDAGGGVLTLTGDRLYHVTGSPGPVPFQDPFARLWEGRTLLDLSWRTGRADGPGTLLRVYRTHDDVNFLSPAIAFQSDDIADFWGMQAQISLDAGGGNLVTLGADYQNEAIFHTDNSGVVFPNQGSDLGLYAQYDWRVTPAVLVSLGVRQDAFTLPAGETNLYGTQIDPRGGVVVLLSDRLLFRAAAGRTYRAPTFDELAPGLFGNPNLQAESAWSYDASLEYALAAGLTLQVDGFYKDATNLITSPPPLFIPVNIGHAIISGGSIELAGRLAPRWFVRANYTSQRARDVATDLDMIYVPRSMANLEIAYRPADGVTIALIVGYSGETFADAANTFVLPGYWLTSVTATWPLGGGYSVLGGVANVFDVHYQDAQGFAEPGRRLFVTMGRSF
ncbi:MAG TPA: TonB-dependent receptor [bacterium]|nr:TonB-dependent receptor [bacterium]